MHSKWNNGSIAPARPWREVPMTPLRARRRAAGMSVEILSAKSGVGGPTIRLAERAPSTMSERTAILLARALGCEPSDLR